MNRSRTAARSPFATRSTSARSVCVAAFMAGRAAWLLVALSLIGPRRFTLRQGFSEANRRAGSLPEVRHSFSPCEKRGRRHSLQKHLRLHRRRYFHSEPAQHRWRELQLVEQRIGLRAPGRTEIIEREILHLVVVPAVMAAVRLAVIGGDDHFVTGFAPAGQEGGEHPVHRVAGMIHLMAVMPEAMAH